MPPGCGSSWNRSSRSSRCGTCGSPSIDDAAGGDRRRSSTTGSTTACRSTISTASFSAESESYLTLGTLTDEPGPTSDYTGQQIYYRSIQQRATDRLTIHDYLWRWDTDWFWCSRAFGAQQPIVRRLWPKRLLRSSFYWKLVALDRRFDIADRTRAAAPPAAVGAGGPGHRGPVGRTAEFVDWFLDTVPIEPIWLCPLRPAGQSAPATATPDLAAVSDRHRRDLRQRRFLVGRAAKPGPARGCDQPAHRAAGQRTGRAQVAVLGCVLLPEDFAALYGGATYARLKEQYDPESRLLNLYDKAVRRQ